MSLPVPLLSVCIPTYNRAALLSEALDALSVQFDQTNRELVEIIVSDNFSSDSTGDVVQHFLVTHSDLQVHYHRQTENIGSDANMLRLVEFAKGRYIFLLSDDDILLPGAVARIISLFGEYPELDALCLNGRPLEEDLPASTQCMFMIDQDRIIVGRDATLLFLGSAITYMSVMVFRKDLLAGHDYRQRVGSFLLPIYMFLDALAGGRYFLVTKEPYLAIRRDNAGGYSYFEVFVTNFNALLKHAESIGYSRDTIKKVRDIHLRQHVIRFVRVFKMFGRYGRLEPNYRDGVSRLLSMYGADPILLFGVIPMMLLPRVFMENLYRVYIFLKRSLVWVKRCM